MIGSRAQVMHGNAQKTSGGLTQKDLKYNKHGRIVSKKVSALAKKNNRLVKAGYIPVKGQFGVKLSRGGVGNVNLSNVSFLQDLDSKSNTGPKSESKLNTAPKSESKLNTGPKSQSKSQSPPLPNQVNRSSPSSQNNSTKIKLDNAITLKDKFDIFVNLNKNELNSSELKPYTHIGELSSGSYGIVHQYNNFAIKMFKGENYIINQEEELELYNKIKLSSLKNNSLKNIIYNILPVYDTDIYPYSVIMPLCNGSIGNLLRNHNLSLECKYNLCKQIIYIVYTLTTHDLYYTDLKVENLLYILDNNKLRVIMGDIGSFNGKVSTYHSLYIGHGHVVKNSNNPTNLSIKKYQKFEIAWAIYNMILYIYMSDFKNKVSQGKFTWRNNRYISKYEDYLSYNRQIKEIPNINKNIIRIIDIYDTILEKIILLINTSKIKQYNDYRLNYMQQFSNTLDEMYKITHIKREKFNKDIILS